MFPRVIKGLVHNCSRTSPLVCFKLLYMELGESLSEVRGEDGQVHALK